MKIKNYLLDLNFLRKNLRFQSFANASKSQLRLKAGTQVGSGRVLVLAPHPDDEMIGCAGVLAKHAQQGDKVKIIFLTDGASNVYQNKILLRGKQAREPREREARAAACVLGLDDLVFWRFPDGKLPSNTTSKKLLQNIIANFKPTIIYTPSYIDSHPDHFESVKILAKTLKSLDNYDAEVNLYEIWTPIFVNRLVSIDDKIELKKEAINQYRSQLQTRSYLKAILGLNQYRAGMFGVGEYAEGFFSCNTELFLELFEQTNLK